MNELPLSDPFWGIADDDGNVTKQSLFATSEEQITNVVWAMEDFLQHNKVFISGIDGRTCHSDSYGTIVDYEALETAVKVLKDKFDLTLDDWKITLDYWLGNPNMQPPLKLVASYIQRKFS